MAPAPEDERTLLDSDGNINSRSPPLSFLRKTSLALLVVGSLALVSVGVASCSKTGVTGEKTRAEDSSCVDLSTDSECTTMELPSVDLATGTSYISFGAEEKTPTSQATGAEGINSNNFVWKLIQSDAYQGMLNGTVPPVVGVATPIWMTRANYGLKKNEPFCQDAHWFNGDNSCYPNNCGKFSGMCYDAKVKDRKVTLVAIGNCGLADDYDGPGNNLKWCTPVEFPLDRQGGACARCMIKKDEPTYFTELWPFKTELVNNGYETHCTDGVYKEGFRGPDYALPVIGAYDTSECCSSEGDIDFNKTNWVHWRGDSSANPQVTEKVELCDGRTQPAIKIKDKTIPVGSCDETKRGSCRNSLGYAQHFDIAFFQKEDGKTSIYATADPPFNEEDLLGGDTYSVGVIKDVSEPRQCEEYILDALYYASDISSKPYACGVDGKILEDDKGHESQRFVYPSVPSNSYFDDPDASPTPAPGPNLCDLPEDLYDPIRQCIIGSQQCDGKLNPPQNDPWPEHCSHTCCTGSLQCVNHGEYFSGCEAPQ